MAATSQPLATQTAIDVLKRELGSIRAGRASPALLDRVQVDYYGAPTAISAMATVSVPDPRTLLIQPWDKSQVNTIVKAIQKSDLGITPNSDSTGIRLSIPPLNEERRRDLVKQVHKRAEEAKVAIRNIRREANEEVKKLEKDGELSQDETHRLQNEVQKLTDKYTGLIEEVLEKKEKEILEV